MSEHLPQTAGPGVSFVEQTDYDPDGILAAVRVALAPLGGMGKFVPKGARVMVKPNLVFGRKAETGINTHPALVRAVLILAKEAGAAWLGVGDSPGYGSARTAANNCGILAVVEKEGAELVEFTSTPQIRDDRTFVRLELARELLDADVIVNLPKMKTHGQMLMSLAVKNMFGAVVGARKLQWHYRAGKDRKFFARMLNDIARAVRPGLSILDAVVGMDGLGPTAGRARPVGFLAASDDPWSLDAAVMDVLGLERSLLFTLADAKENSPDQGAWEHFRWHGPAAPMLRPRDWDIPELVTLQMHGGFIERRLPRLAAWLRNGLAPKPAVKPACIGCGYCREICPAGAIRMQNGKARIDEKLCIRCCCCHELCQHDGMGMQRKAFLARLLGIG